MAPVTAKITRTLAKGLGIERGTEGEKIRRGESVFSVSTVDTAYVEKPPTVGSWFRDLFPSPQDVLRYFYQLLPFLQWIGNYNLQWFVGDMVAGITVGAVVVPQSMAYAGLAQLPPEFGLYSSFVGVLIYWFFATSKDITIGPVAVMSQIVGNVIIAAKKRDPTIPGNVIASALAIIAGSIIISIGLARCGWIVEFISLTVISAFMTGSAINIGVGQVPSLMGITGFNTRAPPYQVFINILKHLGRTTLDSAIGLTALAMLYLIRSFTTWMAKRNPNKRKMWFFISTLRTVFVVLLYTLISWLVNRHHRKKPKFKILKDVPRGFKHMGAPKMNKRIIKAFLPNLPASVIVMLLEHIAISKSFGRVNHYTINPSQELVAIGFTNLFGPFFGAYPATGSFSRTAIKSKAGVRTPFAGVITAIVVLLAIYALTAVFFYIPSSLLSAVIIHAVGDLITPPKTVYHFWQISPVEVVIFFAGVIATVFSTIENGIYTTICASVAVLLFRVIKAKGSFLSKVKIRSAVAGDGQGGALRGDEAKNPNHPEPEDGTRDVFLPIDRRDGSNPELEIEKPYPGVFIYRLSEGFNYLNATNYLDHLVRIICQETKRTNPSAYARLGDRPWNDPGPRRGRVANTGDDHPTLRGVILDFSSVNHIDITSIQSLLDVRSQLDRYASPDKVQWHFVSVKNRWTRRALTAAGFGYPDTDSTQRWKPIFSVAELGGVRDVDQYGSDEKQAHKKGANDPEQARDEIRETRSRVVVVNSLDRPFFHTDLTGALQSTLQNINVGRNAVRDTQVTTALDLQEH